MHTYDKHETLADEITRISRTINEQTDPATRNELSSYRAQLEAIQTEAAKQRAQWEREDAEFMRHAHKNMQRNADHAEFCRRRNLLLNSLGYRGW